MSKPAAPGTATNATPKKLTYKLQRELDQMEAAILEAEAAHESLQALAADPDVIADRQRHEDVCHQLSDAQAEVDRLYARWQELEAMQ